MGSYRTFVHYVRKKKKSLLGSYGQKIRVKNEISRFLKFLSSSTSRLALLDLTPDPSSGGSFGSDPGSEQWWPTTAQSIFQIQKSQTGSLWTRPPPFGTSAENPGTHDLSRYLRAQHWLNKRTVLILISISLQQADSYSIKQQCHHHIH